MDKHDTEQLYESFFVARHPIFTADLEVWGYELLFRRNETAQEAGITDGDMATSQVIADGFDVATRGLRNASKALINFPRNVLLGAAPFVLPPEQCVVEILESVRPEPQIIQACQELKKRGYLLALDDYEGHPGLEPLCEMADIIKIDILNKTPRQVRDIVSGVSRYKAVLVAEKVETHDVFKVCKSLGFTYFQGFFFNRPEIIPGRKLSASEVTRLKLLKELSALDTDPMRLVDIIQTDLSLSYRLLKYINSAFFGLQVQVTSIQRAVTMLGCQNLRQWLQVVILSDLNTSDRAQELVRISAQRARFLQLLASLQPTPFDQDGMFLLGFFSLLDAILDQPMSHVLEEIPLDPAVKKALVDPASPDAAWIGLLGEMERGNWVTLRRASEQLGVPMALLGRLSADAVSWAAEIMS